MIRLYSMLTDSILSYQYKCLASNRLKSFKSEMNKTTPTPQRPRRNTSVTIHLSKEEKSLIAQMAFDRDEGTSQFARKLILTNLKKLSSSVQNATSRI